MSQASGLLSPTGIFEEISAYQDWGANVIHEDAKVLDAKLRLLYAKLPSVQQNTVSPLFDKKNETGNRQSRRATKPWMGGDIKLGEAKPLEERIFHRLVALKVLTSRVAMHLDPAWKNGIFKQLDNLLSFDDWEPDFPLPSEESFSTFLRLVTHLRPHSRPSLGATEAGTLVASWTLPGLDLFVDFLPSGLIRWVVRSENGERTQSLAGNTEIVGLMPSLMLFGPEKWFAAGHVA